MAGFRALSPNITSTTASAQLRIELLNTFARLDGQLSLAPYRIATQNGPVGNTGTSETDLMSTTIDFGTLNAIGASILIFACGTTAANGNNKTLKLILGSTTLFTSGAIAMNNVDWTFQGEVIFNGGTSQIAWGQFLRNGSSPVVETNTATENFATSLALKFTGTGGASSDIAVSYHKMLLLK